MYAIISRVGWSRFVTVVVLLVLVLTWATAAVASAADLVPGPGEPAPVPGGDALTALPLGVVVTSFVVTGLGYALNYVIPVLRSEQAKGLAHALYQAVGVVGYEIAFTDDFGLNEKTGVAFMVALGTYGFSHGLLYKPPGWNAALGGGRNMQVEKTPRRIRRARPVTRKR